MFPHLRPCPKANWWWLDKKRCEKCRNRVEVELEGRKEPEPEAPLNDRRTAREDAGQSGKGERKAISGIGIGKRKGPMR